MSNPGINPMQAAMAAGSGQVMTNQMTPEFLQQMQAYQDQQKRSQLANALMQNGADPTTANAGISNAGSDIAGAVISNKMADNAKWAAQGLSPVTVTPQVGTTGLGRFANMFGLGGS
jgi:hypothetical protein